MDTLRCGSGKQEELPLICSACQQNYSQLLRCVCFPPQAPQLISSHLISPLLLLLSFLSLDIVFKISLNLSGCHFRPPAGSLHHPIREPRQDPGAAPADPVPLGRLLLLRSQNRLNYSGGEAAEMKQDKSLKKEKGV